MSVEPAVSILDDAAIATPARQPLEPIIFETDLNALLAALEHERIAERAYFYWEQRGRPEGSSEEDWLRAEHEIRLGF